MTSHDRVVTLLSRPGCHLCDQAREIIARVTADLGVAWSERDITLSASDLEEYWDKIPVTLIDGVTHDFWHVSESRLRRALTSELPGPERGHGAFRGAIDSARYRPGWGQLCAYVHKGVPWNLS